MKNLDKTEKIVGYIGLAGCIIAALAIVFNFGVIIADVFGRFVLHKAVRGSSEYVGLGETVLIFFGMAYTQHKKGMVEITFFMRKLPGQGPMICWTFVNWLSAIVGVLLTYASFVHAGFLKTMKAATDTLYIPYYPFYYLMAVGLTLFAIELVYGAIRNTIGLFHKDLRERIISEWPM